MADNQHFNFSIHFNNSILSEQYTGVLWNNQKKKYDKLLWLGILLFIGLYFLFQFLFHPDITVETIIIRSTALCAFILLHIILAIGPLSRIDSRFLPMLYNRRHLGVSMFLIALLHGAFSMIQFHSFGDKNVLLSLFTSNQKYSEISQFPFQTLGFFALIILLFMASTSHDFWMKNLHRKIWKGLHMCVYLVYLLIFLHVATGSLQYESHPFYWFALIFGFVLLSGLHIYTGFIAKKSLSEKINILEKEGFYQVCSIHDIKESRAKTCFINGENVAIFKYEGKVSAVHNVCKHQMGPLGEGKIIDGCITCPWHGYQYLPENGKSPEPFTEKVKTYDIKVINDNIWVNLSPNPEGTYVQPAKIKE